jgi:hypothetical protein
MGRFTVSLFVNYSFIMLVIVLLTAYSVALRISFINIRQCFISNPNSDTSSRRSGNVRE